ncbi:MAG: AIR synthase-related protein, partial [Candidatus Omnitrophica bacterium]|nr:AIR synthase-related protein [Candidatus Omnitrophota bacterium]
DSLYNEYTVGSKRIHIPGTLLISAMSIIEGWQNTATGNLKAEGNLLYCIGMTKNELGASEYFRYRAEKKGIVPKIDKKISKKILEAVSKLVRRQLISSCHDISEGGIAVSVAEMCIGSQLGAQVFLKEAPQEKNMQNFEVLFSESPSRFIVEVEKKNKEKFERLMQNSPFGLIGCVCADKKLTVYGIQGQEIINSEVTELKQAWLDTFKEFR